MAQISDTEQGRTGHDLRSDGHRSSGSQRSSVQIIGSAPRWVPCIKKDGERERETSDKSSALRSQPPELLIIAASKNSCLLMNQIPDKRLIGSMVLPKQEATVGISGPERRSEKTCPTFELEKLREQGEKGGGDVIAVCAEDVPANQTVAWTKALFQIFKPQRNQYSVSLPSGNVVDGLVAAVMTYCQVRDMDAAAFLRLEQFGATVGDSADPLTIMSMLLESFSTIPLFTQLVNVNNVVKATSASISENALKGPLSDIFRGNHAVRHKATTLQGSTGRADEQHSNHAVKHKATPTRRLYCMVRNQRTWKAWPVEGRQGSGAAKRKATPTTWPQHSANTAACREPPAKQAGHAARQRRSADEAVHTSNTEQSSTYSHHD
ncbi:hypothetical protein CBR_g31493 [Chara braunii]|uniref:Uncharacterized protein n=1 Tax=Chara braunii TaxID=69332 RepID=A0A388LFA0_CHABU|nr:hypothetical protein CBR_g31493 [Chara braunii]|eukprot:GBG80937.1 hypothetical protein CBR_g31493 [Chara braunii]